MEKKAHIVFYILFQESYNMCTCTTLYRMTSGNRYLFSYGSTVRVQLQRTRTCTRTVERCTLINNYYDTVQYVYCTRTVPEIEYLQRTVYTYFRISVIRTRTLYTYTYSRTHRATDTVQSYEGTEYRLRKYFRTFVRK